MYKFQWKPIDISKHYFLDLGIVCFTTEVFINGKPAGKIIFASYLLDVTSVLKLVINLYEVHVTPGELNGVIRDAKNGDKRFAQFKGKEDQTMSAGLIGPVIIRTEK